MRMWRPDLVLLHYLNGKDKLTRKSVLSIEMEEKRVKSNEIILIVLITIFILFFFAHSIEILLGLLAFGLTIGIFGLIKDKDYKERRRT